MQKTAIILHDSFMNKKKPDCFLIHNQVLRFHFLLLIVQKSFRLINRDFFRITFITRLQGNNIFTRIKIF